MGEYSRASDFQISSLKKKEESGYNLMLPGRGIPWEDRGAIGIFPAFFRTAFATLFGHPNLLDQLRRPEISAEASTFALGCASAWGLSIVLWDIYRYWVLSSQTKLYTVAASQYWLETALEVGGVIVGAFLLLKIGSKIFSGLVANSSDKAVPEVLTYNVFAYSMGPSVIAIIPVFGWAVALVWIFLNTIIGAHRRLYLKTREAITNAILVWLILIGISTGVCFGVWFLWNDVLATSSVQHVEPPKKIVPRGG